MGAGQFMRGCLEYSKPVQGFCDNVPSPTSIRETAAWQSKRCGDDAHCRIVIPGVQTYCTDGRPKRQAADTLLMEGGSGADGPAPGGVPGGAGADSIAAGAEADSSSF
ncbi:MAG TPA: hypothetical protein VE871_16560 [Longimicrobium sp.]|nr:hypothetical protein [Longimicrobium sp.]